MEAAGHRHRAAAALEQHPVAGAVLLFYIEADDRGGEGAGAIRGPGVGLAVGPAVAGGQVKVVVSM